MIPDSRRGAKQPDCVPLRTEDNTDTFDDLRPLPDDLPRTLRHYATASLLLSAGPDAMS